MKPKLVVVVGFAILFFQVCLSRDLRAQDSRSKAEVAEWSQIDDRVRLTPYFAIWMFSGDLDLKENLAMGLRFNYEVPGMVGVSLEYGYSRTDMDFDQQDDLLFTHITALGAFGEYRDDIWGNLHHIGVYVTWNNPELSTEKLETWMGFGFGGFIRQGFRSRNAVDPLPVLLGSVTPPAAPPAVATGVPAEYDLDGYMIHFSTTVELNYKVTPNFSLGLLWREHFVFANKVNDDDDMNVEVEANFPRSVVSELGLHFSFTF